MFKSFFIFILLFIFIYYLIKAIFRLANLFFQIKNNQSSFSKSRKTKGNVTIEYPEEQKKIFSKDSGEYIDYEEVK